VSKKIVNLIDPALAVAIREHVAELEAAGGDPLRMKSGPLQEYPEVFAPKGEANLAVVERENNRAGCRECGETIEKGSRAIVFGLDPMYERTGGEGPWGHLSAAFIHADPADCRREET
jgi:hypothetical protein